MLDFFKITPKKRHVRLKRGKGIIYHNPPGHLKVVFNLANLFLLGGVVYLVYLYLPLTSITVGYFLKGQSRIEVAIKEESATESKPVTTVEEVVPDRFKIEIPKINADTWVVTGVSPFDQEEYTKVLEEGVIAQAKDSGLPGGGDGTSIFMFAHSSQPIASAVRNNPIFYLLGEMNNDDKVIVDYNGKKYTYQVYDKKVVNAKDTEYLTYSDPDKEVVILQTCWPIGTNWKRLLVFANLVTE